MSNEFNPGPGKVRQEPALALTRSAGHPKPAHASVYLLADHLDTVLAACEDISNAHLTWNSARQAGSLEVAAEKHDTRDAIEEIRKLENTVIMRVLKSRERAEEVARADKRFRQLAKLYVAGTAVLIDAVEDCGDSTDADFAAGDSIPAYLRSRGLVDPEAPAPAIGEDLSVGEDFLIAKRIATGPLMDLAAALLDALELHYDLFLDDDELSMPPQVDRADAIDDRDDSTSVDAGPADDLSAAIDDVRQEAARQRDDLTADLWSRLDRGGIAADSVSAPLSAAHDDDEDIDTDTTERPSRFSGHWKDLRAKAVSAMSVSAPLNDDADDDTAAQDTAPESTSEDDVPTEITALTSSRHDHITLSAAKIDVSDEDDDGDAAVAQDDTQAGETVAAAPDRAESDGTDHRKATSPAIVEIIEEPTASKTDIPVSVDAEVDDDDALEDTRASADTDEAEDDVATGDTNPHELTVTAANDDEDDVDLIDASDRAEDEVDDDAGIEAAAEDPSAEAGMASGSDIRPDEEPEEDDRQAASPADTTAEDDDGVKAEANDGAGPDDGGDKPSKPKSLISRLSRLRS